MMRPAKKKKIDNRSYSFSVLCVSFFNDLYRGILYFLQNIQNIRASYFNLRSDIHMVEIKVRHVLGLPVLI